MDVLTKHLATLEFPKVLARLASYTSFSAGAELAQNLTPAIDLEGIRASLRATSEARLLLEAKSDTTMGGARDIRPHVAATLRDAVLTTGELLDVRDTLVAARVLHRLLTRLESQFPLLATMAGRIHPSPEIIDEINRCLDERGNVRDDASPELARIRREARIANDRIHDKLQSIIGASANAPYLQEPIITQREGRYVIPLKADFRGRIRGIVHDMSASGATVFIEPLSVVELNNTWRELQLQEQQEIERILRRLSTMIAERADDLRITVVALAELDLTFAKARYAEALNAAAPELAPLRKQEQARADGQHPGSTIRLMGARHPLLDPQTVVPIDIAPEPDVFMVIITGPNTGGKTVSLKTVGLLTIMAQAGLHIPAERGSVISPFEAVYADIGDEQSIEQSLSTFSSHLTNIMSFIEKTDRRSLVLLDELGAGTDPTEGAALARALLEHLRARGVTTFVATHYPELKSYAQLTPGVTNASVEFDPETLSPTYRLTIGLPGRSNAFAIAARLGLPSEIVEAARGLVSRQESRTEDMLADIHRLRLQTVQARDDANAARAEAERTSRELRDRLAGIEDERQEIIHQARAEAERELDALQTEVRTLRHRLQAAAAPLQSVTAIEEALEELEERIPEPEPVEPALPPAVPQRPIEPGDTVWVRLLNTEGKVLTIGPEGAEVLMGMARIRLSPSVLELRAPAETPAPEKPAGERAVRASEVVSPGTRLDLRGQTVEDAIERLDLYLDTASRAGLPWTHIIHGKGTGALRRAVREFLSQHPLVSSYESPPEAEGGDGVTVAKLVQT
ncbi:MAG: endonuclease MutS2 [Anaerolineales bacterium]|nr:endonuclease MutS2 [Anaerolineales bacterium]